MIEHIYWPAFLVWIIVAGALHLRGAPWYVVGRIAGVGWVLACAWLTFFYG